MFRSTFSRQSTHFFKPGSQFLANCAGISKAALCTFDTATLVGMTYLSRITARPDIKYVPIDASSSAQEHNSFSFSPLSDQAESRLPNFCPGSEMRTIEARIGVEILRNPAVSEVYSAFGYLGQAEGKLRCRAPHNPGYHARTIGSHQDGAGRWAANPRELCEILGFDLTTIQTLTPHFKPVAARLHDLGKYVPNIRVGFDGPHAEMVTLALKALSRRHHLSEIELTYFIANLQSYKRTGQLLLENQIPISGFSMRKAAKIREKVTTVSSTFIRTLIQHNVEIPTIKTGLTFKGHEIVSKRIVESIIRDNPLFSGLPIDDLTLSGIQFHSTPPTDAIAQGFRRTISAASDGEEDMACQRYFESEEFKSNVAALLRMFPNTDELFAVVTTALADAISKVPLPAGEFGRHFFTANLRRAQLIGKYDILGMMIQEPSIRTSKRGLAIALELAEDYQKSYQNMVIWKRISEEVVCQTRVQQADQTVLTWPIPLRVNTELGPSGIAWDRTGVLITPFNARARSSVLI